MVKTDKWCKKVMGKCHGFKQTTIPPVWNLAGCLAVANSAWCYLQIGRIIIHRWLAVVNGGTHINSVRCSEVHQQGHITEAAVRITLLGLITCTETINDRTFFFFFGSGFWKQALEDGGQGAVETPANPSANRKAKKIRPEQASSPTPNTSNLPSVNTHRGFGVRILFWS